MPDKHTPENPKPAIWVRELDISYEVNARTSEGGWKLYITTKDLGFAKQYKKEAVEITDYYEAQIVQVKREVIQCN